MFPNRFLALLCGVLPLVTAAATQEPTEAPPTEQLGCDRTAIRWFGPGDFGAAREKAEHEKRLVLIKGISFGVDELGASCATKGRW